MKVDSFCSQDCPLECDSLTYSLITSYSNYPTRVYAGSLAANPSIVKKILKLNDHLRNLTTTTTSNINSQDLPRLSYEQIKSNMIAISIYYAELSYEQYDELEKIGLTDLVSSIGGTLGLFLGMSFLSFVEIIDIILQILVFKFYSSRRKVKPKLNIKTIDSDKI